MPLTVLSASAGSGKTYRLTREYVRMCLREENPAAAGSILAMTFTNKATAEMKSRILDLLRAIADQSENIQSDPALDVLAELLTTIGYQQLAHRADQCLRYLIKNYHYFSVSTIDSFFQKVIRQFQRELGRYHPYSIELNQRTVLDHAISRMLDSLTEGSAEYKWIAEWISENMANDKNWDIKRQLSDLGREIFSEQYRKSNTGKDATLEEVELALREIRDVLEAIEKKLADNRAAVQQVLDHTGLEVSAFSNGASGVVGIWINPDKDLQALMESARFTQFDGDVTRLFKATDRMNVPVQIIQQLEQGLLPLYYEMTAMLANDMPKWIAYRAIGQNVRTFVALRFLRQHIEDYCTDRDVMLLSSANELVASALNEADVNMLYEKSGEQYHHLLVDEFQDTSQLQWQGIRPLMENSLAEGRQSLIVGDIKQSIYRWRNSDWRLMHHTVKRDFARFEPISESLEDNWRSTRQIVDFNNAFYERVAGTVFAKFMENFVPHEYATAFREIYSSVAQNPRVATTEEGSVLISELPALKGNVSADLDIDLQGWVKAQLNRLFSLNFRRSDIAFLVRDNKEVRLLMEWFSTWDAEENMVHKYRAVSEKGFLLENNGLVQLLVSLWNFRQNPANKSLIAVILWLRQNFDRKAGDADQIFNTGDTQPELPKLWLHYLKQPVSTLSEWFTGFIRLAGYENSAPLYLTTFLDTVRKFELEYGNEPAVFAEWWDEHSSGFGIPSDRSMDAMQVLTIHTAKGLEFPVVMMPFTRAPLEGESKGNLYVSIESNPILKALGHVPVRISGKLKHAEFNAAYIDEYLLRIIDQINLLYVATTRPVKHLLMAVRKTSINSLYTFGDLILDCMPTNVEAADFYPDTYVFGNAQAGHSADEYESAGFEPEVLAVSLRSHTLKAGAWHFKPLPDESASGDATSRGLMIHTVLEHLQDADSLEKCLAELRELGIMSRESIAAVRPAIEAFLQDDTVKTWYAANTEVYAEREIIEVDGKAYRPDRVVYSKGKTAVIDFKTGRGSDRHKLQLKKYMELLQKMGFPQIEGKLAYLEPLTIETIKL